MRHTDGADYQGADSGAADSLFDAGKSKQSRRLVWTDELHRRFEEAVAKLGSENAKPQAIQQLMNVGGITTRNIKSHLQVPCRFPRSRPGPLRARAPKMFRH
ncbi:hypothetical protein T492DRAFT_599236 [Pavlovales sp. CCMP2436]|nr:hypothetical protein T492DRAFT_599236 [Pavlovales sp. CCMP2436]